MAPFPTLIPLCGNSEKPMTVQLSVDQPPTSVKVPLDPNDATKFRDLPVDPSFWEKLYTELTDVPATQIPLHEVPFGDVSLWKQLQTEFADCRIADDVNVTVDPKTVASLCSNFYLGQLHTDAMRLKRLYSIRNLINESIDGRAEYMSFSDKEAKTLLERLNNAFNYQKKILPQPRNPYTSLSSSRPHREYLLAVSYMVLAECASGVGPTFKAHIPLCGNTKKSLTVHLSIEQPPAYVRVPLNPNDATKFQDHPVDPSMWEKLDTALDSYWRASKHAENISYEKHTEIRQMKVSSKQKAEKYREADQASREYNPALWNPVHTITDLIYESFDGRAEYTKPEDKQERAVTVLARIYSADDYHYDKLCGPSVVETYPPQNVRFDYRGVEHRLATIYTVLAESASLAWTAHNASGDIDSSRDNDTVPTERTGHGYSRVVGLLAMSYTVSAEGPSSAWTVHNANGDFDFWRYNSGERQELEQGESSGHASARLQEPESDVSD